MNVLYYSNYCNYCKDIINILSKSNIKNTIHFLCIDNRIKKNNKTFILLENGKEVSFPDFIKTVPSMILFTRGNMLLEGNEIHSYINSYNQEHNTTNNDEPSAFSHNYNSIVSDTYSFIDTDISQLDSKEGNAGLMQMHNYVSINYSDNIITPPDNYVPNKISSENSSIDDIIKKRNEEIPLPVKPI